jgi:hypothetical protein
MTDTYTPTLPADINAERAVLGSCLLDRDAILVVRDLLSAAEFYLEKHAWVYEALIACVVARTPPDLVTVSNELKRRERLEPIGGVVFLSELIEYTPAAVHVEHYAQIVARTAAQRRLIQISGEMQAAAYDQSIDLDALYQEIQQHLKLEERISSQKPEWARVTYRGDVLYKTKFPPKPDIVDQILPQGTMLLTGKPKTKKSWLALNLALAVAWGGKALGHFEAQKGDVLYVDLEMGARRLHERLHTVSPETVTPKSLHFATEWPQVYSGCERWLSDWMEQHPFTKLIIFDTQVAIRPPRGRNEEPYEHEKKYTQVLSNFCHQHGIAMILIHHSRKVAGGDVIDDASGTTGLTAGVDNYGSLSRRPGEKDAGILRLMGRDIRLDDELNLKWDNTIASWCFNNNVERYTLTPERRIILSLLQQSPGLYPNQIAERLKKEPVTVRRILQEMKKSEQVVSMENRYYANDQYEADTA